MNTSTNPCRTAAEGTPVTEKLSDILQNVFTSSKVVNETVMFIDKGNAKSLLHTPERILSVTSYDGQTVYEEGRDYQLKDGKLVIPETSTMPCITSAVYFDGSGMIVKDGQKLYWGEGDTMTRWQVCVTYTHADKWDKYLQKNYADRYTDFIGKLERGEDVTVYFYGDSITAGANASYFVGVAPYQQPYTVLFLQALAETFEYTVKFVDVTPDHAASDKIPTSDLVCGTRGTITYVNSAIGGWASQNGADSIDGVLENIRTYGCDLFVLAFGMNDGAAPASEVSAVQNGMLQKVHAVAPDAALMMVATMVPHIGTEWDSNQKTQWVELEKSAEAFYESGIPCALANMTKVSLSLYETKDFEDCTGNNINHPNDFIDRLYAQTLFQTLLGYDYVVPTLS